MTFAASTQDEPDLAASKPGPPAEIRRFWAGMRIVIALLVATLMFSSERDIAGRALAVMSLYFTWSAWLLWVEANDQSPFSALWTYWIDVAWSCLMMAFWREGAMMLTLTLVYPVVLNTIGFGIRHGLLLALMATVGMILGDGKHLNIVSGLAWQQYIMLLLMFSLVPAAALIARPMSIRLRGLSLAGAIQAELDPRHGLEPMCVNIVERLRQATQANAVALVLPSRLGAPAVLAELVDGSFRAAANAHALLERLLAQLPRCPIMHIERAWWDPRHNTRFYPPLTSSKNVADSLAELAQLLAVQSLCIVPLIRYGNQHGHILIGYAAHQGLNIGALELSELAPELLRSIEEATLVDQVQEESASHERARIGRDLHDSAIQPYLGLKYAVESVALGIPNDNPARAAVDSLADLVNSEVSALRELISGLRTGNEHGDSAFVPAIRRQIRRFSALFGVEIEMDCPAALVTTRALAGALFHMVNEVLNNIRKHTRAKRIWLTIALEDNIVRIVVRDDGGTQVGRPTVNFRPKSLLDRAAELNGTLDISRPDGLNTSMVIQIPINQN